MRFVFEPHNNDNGQFDPVHGVVVNLSSHKTLVYNLIDTIIHEHLHKAISDCGCPSYELYDTYDDGEELVVRYLTDRSMENYEVHN